MNEELKFDHFENIEELLKHIDIWYGEDDIFYTRYFGLNDLHNLGLYIKQLQNNWNELKGLIDERIEDCRYFLANADVNYKKENMKNFMWLKEELQVLKSKMQELEQGEDE